MKALKKFLKGFLCYIITNLFILLLLSFSLNSIFSQILTTAFATGSVTDEIIKEIKESANEDLNEEIPEEVKEKVGELLEDKETKALFDKYLNAALSGIVDDEDLESINIEEDAINFIKSHETELEEIIGEDITEEQMQKFEQEAKDLGLTKQFKESIEESKETLPPDAKNIMKLYNFYTSTTAKVILILGIIICTILIALLQKSFFMWIHSLSICALISGITLTIISLLGSFVVNAIFASYNQHINFSTKTLTTEALITFAIGLITLITYNIIMKKINKETKKDEISQVSFE